MSIPEVLAFSGASSGFVSTELSREPLYTQWEHCAETLKASIDESHCPGDRGLGPHLEYGTGTVREAKLMRRTHTP